MKKTPLFILTFSLIFIISCNKNSYKSGKNISQATGWKINSSDGGFKLNTKFKGQINAPGMIFIQGGVSQAFTPLLYRATLVLATLPGPAYTVARRLARFRTGWGRTVATLHVPEGEFLLRLPPCCNAISYL